MEHEHCHHHGKLQGRKLIFVTILNLAITAVQIAGGVISGSLSLLSDALHNFADSSAIFIAFAANRISLRKADRKKTFGYKRAEIIAALFNGSVLIAVCLFLFYEAYLRFRSPETVDGKVMLGAASFGLLANLISIIFLHSDKKKNLNIKTAYLHLLGDTLSSVAVIAGGICIYLWNITWIDPLITVVVCFYVVYHAWGAVSETVDILMHTVPEEISLDEIRTSIEKVEGVDNLHHVHVWKLNDSQIHFEAHINLRS
ncbi:MAG: cation transporter, partial [Spirochaetes bacterium]|nr:cation transporter [Spirochaetota bacterium]